MKKFAVVVISIAAFAHATSFALNKVKDNIDHKDNAVQIVKNISGKNTKQEIDKIDVGNKSNLAISVVERNDFSPSL